MRPTRLLRLPLVHFLAGGGLLFRIVYGPAPFAAAAHGGAAPVVVSAEDVARLARDYTRETGLAPTPDDEAALVDKAIDEELLVREARARGLDRRDRSVRAWLVEQMGVLAGAHDADEDTLYRRALALGLDRTDVVVRRILVQKMRLLAARTNERDPSDEALRAFYAAHRDEYAPPARVSLWHVFLASATHGQGAPDAAAALLAALRREGRAPADAIAAGEAFSVPPHLIGAAPSQLEKLFGPAFATWVARADVRTWTGPVPSAYGAHLVWIESREPGVPPAFEDVRSRVRERWQDEQRARRVAELLRDLRRHAVLQVESTAWRQGRAT